MDGLIKWLEGINAKLPALPTGFREFLVKAAPYLVIISIIFGIPTVFAVLGVGTYFAAYGGAAMPELGFASWYWIFLAATIVLNIVALPGLFRRTTMGWTFVFYGVLIGVVGSLLMGSFVGALISLAIELYVLMQVRPYYIGMATMSASSKQQPPAASKQ